MNEEKTQEPEDFDRWLQNPYTRVLMASIRDDYMPRSDAMRLIRAAESASPSVNEEKTEAAGGGRVPLARLRLLRDAGAGLVQAKCGRGITPWGTA